MDFGKINSIDEVKPLDSQNPVVGAIIDLTIVPGRNTIVKYIADQNSTINILAAIPQEGDELTIIITNDGILPRTTTLGALLSNIGVAVGVINTINIIRFISDGVKFIETSRNIGLV